MTRKTDATRQIDAHVGRKLRELRLAQSRSQKEFAGKLGVSQQQLYKYETGENAISAGILFDLSKLLGVSPAFFFEGLNTNGIQGTSQPAHFTTEQLGLIRVLDAIRPEQRLAVLALLHTFTAAEAA